jgi:putative RecB family exonuclease
VIDTTAPAAPADLATLPLPVRESHSSLSTYAACPRRYAFRYVEHLPGEVPHWWFTFGSAVHRAFEAFDRARIRARREGMPAPGYDVLARAFGEALDAAACEPDEAARYRARSEPVLLAYLERAVTSDAEPVGVELGFGVDVPVADDEPPLRFVGYIDRIDRRSDGAIEVIDHKTGRLRSQEDVDRDRQLTAYAFACARGGLRDPATGEVLPAATRLGLHFAEAGLTVWTTRSAEQLETFGARLVAEAGAIRRREFDPRAGASCRWCEYRAACPDAAPLEV